MKIKNIIIAIILSITAFSFAGCESLIIKKGYVKKAEMEQKIDSLNKDHDLAVKKTEAELRETLEKIINSLNLRLQAGANSLYGANEAFKFYKTPARLDLIINNRVTEAQAAIGTEPTFEAVKKENARLKDELDENKTSLEQLRKNHEIVVADNTKLKDDTKKLEADLASQKDEYTKMEKSFGEKIKEAQEALNAKNNEIIALEHKRADETKSIEKLKRELMLACGIGAALAMVGAIYSPIGKRGLVIAAGVLGGAAVAIPFIQPWMIVTVVLTTLGLAVMVFLRKQFISEKVNENLVNAIQDTKDDPSVTTEVKGILKKNLSGWNAEYAKDSVGNVIEKANKSVESYIEEKLKKYGRLKVTSIDKK